MTVPTCDTLLVIQSTSPVSRFHRAYVVFVAIGPIHPNADLAPLGNQTTSSGAGKRDYLFYTGTCESLESEGRGGKGEGGQMAEGKSGLRKIDNVQDR